MDFDHRIKLMEIDLENKSKELEELKNTFKDTHKFTAYFLNKCKDVGIKTVSIGKKTDKINSSKKWPFDHSGSCFADERYNDWPAIWKACEIPELGKSCGNGGQSACNTARLIDGVYEYKNGCWNRIE